MAQMFASFHCRGNDPCSIDDWNIFVSIGASFIANIFRHNGATYPAPVLCLASSSAVVSRLPLQRLINFGMSPMLLVPIDGTFASLSVVNTLANRWLSASVFPLPSHDCVVYQQICNSVLSISQAFHVGPKLLCILLHCCDTIFVICSPFQLYLAPSLAH